MRHLNREPTLIPLDRPPIRGVQSSFFHAQSLKYSHTLARTSALSFRPTGATHKIALATTSRLTEAAESGEPHTIARIS